MMCAGRFRAMLPLRLVDFKSGRSIVAHCYLQASQSLESEHEALAVLEQTMRDSLA